MTLSRFHRAVITSILLFPMLAFLYWHYGRIENIMSITGIGSNEAVNVQEVKILKRPNYLGEIIDKVTITDVKTCTELFESLRTYKLRKAFMEREPRHKTYYLIAVKIRDKGTLKLVVEGKNHLVVSYSKDSDPGHSFLYKIIDKEFDIAYLEKLLNQYRKYQGLRIFTSGLDPYTLTTSLYLF